MSRECFEVTWSGTLDCQRQKSQQRPPPPPASTPHPWSIAAKLIVELLHTIPEVSQRDMAAITGLGALSVNEALCSLCNKKVVGRKFTDPEFLRRGARGQKYFLLNRSA